MKRILLSSVLVSVAVVAPAITAGGADLAGSITLSVRTPTGVMAGAPVAVYLMPFDHPDTYTPPTLAQGETNAAGVFAGTLDMAVVYQMLSDAHDDGHIFNLMIVAADAATGWMATWFHAADLFSPTLLDILAQTNISTDARLSRMSERQLVRVGPIEKVSDGGRRCPTVAFCEPDQTRWPDVITWSNAPGIDSSFTFESDASQSHETITSVTFTNNKVTWSLSGTHAENRSRGAGAGPYTRSNVTYNATWEASYTFEEYANCPRGTCVGYWWEPQFWNGDLRQAGTVGLPAFDAAHASILNVPKYRDSTQTKTYTSSFALEGIQNTSRAAYARSTRMDWVPLDPGGACGGAKHDYLYGNGAVWTVAAAVWTACT